jgi:hypothetical protein
MTACDWGVVGVLLGLAACWIAVVSAEIARLKRAAAQAEANNERG